MSIASELFKNSNDPFGVLSAQGRLFRAGPSASNVTVTSNSTSFANTDPTFLLSVPAGVTVVPAEMSIFQAGTVAGGLVTVILEMDDADRYSSGGLAATILATDMRGQLPKGIVAGVPPRLFSCTGSPIVATNAYGVQHKAYPVGQDVSPAEGAVNEINWLPSAGVDFLTGPASWLIYTFATGTAPTWFWSFKFAAFPSLWMQD